MEPLVWNATSGKPFGRSRLKKPIRTLIDDYVRTVANASIALEFDTTPQKYLLGVTDEQYDAIVAEKFKTYVGSLLTATANPETGENPTFGQLAQGSLTPHVEKNAHDGHPVRRRHRADGHGRGHRQRRQPDQFGRHSGPEPDPRSAGTSS